MKLIDTDALVAEIERRRDEIRKGIFSIPLTGSDRAYATFEYKILEKIKDFIDTLEVKEVDLEKDARQILSLYYEGIKHYDDIIKEEREENGGSDLAIKIMDGVVDARELGIQYVIDKLKAHKGE